MKTIVFILLLTGAGCALTWNFAVNRQHARETAQLADRQAAWDKERSELEAALSKAANRPLGPSAYAPEIIAAASAQPTPQEIIERLKIAKPGNSSRNSRMVIA